VLTIEYELVDVSGRVQKFRSVEDMANAPFQARPGEGFERFARHCARFFALWPRKYPPGVFRFRSLEEAQAARARVTAESLKQAASTRSGD
jgi:hypothetical protein